MKRELSPVIIVVALVVLIGGTVLAFTYLTKPRPPAGVKYTPGVPPWQDPQNGNKSEYKPR